MVNKNVNKIYWTTKKIDRGAAWYSHIIAGYITISIAATTKETQEKIFAAIAEMYKNICVICHNDNTIWVNLKDE